MISTSGALAAAADQTGTPEDMLTTYRARRALEDDARAQQRQLDLEGQRANANPPRVRIHHWEKLHGLRLPMDTEHPVLDVIAIGTRLTLAEVQGEQLARRLRRP
jgi:hypothetical protein